MEKQTMHLIVEARPENESFSRSVVGAFATRLNPTLLQLSDIQTAISETVTNCVVHAYSNKSGTIQIIATIDGDWLEVEIIDTGCGIDDIERAKQPFYTTGAHMERSGMGFTIMDAFMDDVIIKSETGKGTSITLKKQIIAPKTKDEEALE